MAKKIPAPPFPTARVRTPASVPIKAAKVEKVPLAKVPALAALSDLLDAPSGNKGARSLDMTTNWVAPGLDRRTIGHTSVRTKPRGTKSDTNVLRSVLPDEQEN
jgi:hypothetical protein